MKELEILEKEIIENNEYVEKLKAFNLVTALIYLRATPTSSPFTKCFKMLGTFFSYSTTAMGAI